MDKVITNEQGIYIIKKYEGLVDGDPETPGLDPYYDPIGIPTIGYGSTYGIDGTRVTMSHRAITSDEASYLLKRELSYTETYVAKLVIQPVTINQFSALCSLTYNIGSGNFQASTMRMKLNRRDYYGAECEFWKWRRAGGRILRGLVLRREEERQLYGNL